MKTAFERAFGELNDRQRQAVETIDGPVLVIAGPGTGKTQLLSMRVASILKKTDTKPNNILALTYTNKAAVNMKDRIIELAGQDGARVAASTFHSFAAEIMNLYPDNFWNAARLAIAPESVQLDIIESIVRQLPLDNPLALKFAGQYTLLNDIQRSINLAKDAGLTPDKLRALLSVNIAYIDEIEAKLIDITSQRLSAKSLDSFSAKINALPKQKIDQTIYPLTSLSTVITDSLAQAIEADRGSSKCTNTGKWKSRWVQTVGGQRGMFAERAKNEWWRQLANVYEEYRQELHGRGFYDYADMLVETISQLEQNPEMLADIQERFNYVLLDEFQDTTPAQLRLAHLVADHYSAEGQPNLMAVGDDDQSIFKFNGAELNNMLGFKRAYPAAKIIVLTDNYRSSQAILDTAKKIIEQADSRLVKAEPALSKHLVAASPPKDKGQIRALAYPSSELQLSEIARDIKQNYQPKRQIAVLARGHESLIKMAGILQQLKVPVRYEQAANILEHEIVNQTYLISKLLLAIQDGDRDTANGLIHQIIRWPAWGVAPRELWCLAAANYPNKDWQQSLLASRVSSLKAVGNWFIRLARQADAQPLAVTIEQILGLRASPVESAVPARSERGFHRVSGDFRSPIKNYFINDTRASANKYFHGLSAIQLLRALVHEFGKDREPTLKELVRFIEINKANGIIVADESPFITGAAAVQLLSVHKAKGLEFDHVYIIDAIDDNWRPRAGGRKPPSNLPLQPAGDDLDDYARLMYVAASRARSSITISAYFQDHSGKDVALSSIAQSAFHFKPISQGKRQNLITVLEENLRWPQLSGGQEKEILKARLEGYNLSVTHLLNFLDLEKGGPRYFKERNLLRLPEAKTASLAYGTAMHSALDAAQKLANRGQFNLARISREFNRALVAEQLPQSEHKRYQAQGKRILARLFKEFGYRLPAGSSSEQKLRDIRLERAIISGKLDRVDNDGDKLKIIDYKTGRPLNSFTTKDKNQALKAHKHRLQLIFYALLLNAQADVSKIGNIEGQMIYIEADNQKRLVRPYTPTKEDVERLGRLIEAVWARIVKLDFPDVSQYPPSLEGVLGFEKDLIGE